MMGKAEKMIRHIIENDYPEVAMLYRFGSRVDGTAGPQSDYDFAALVDRQGDSAAIRSGLASELSRQLGTSRIDLVLLQNAPIDLAFAIISKGEILYERNINTRVEFEARIMGLYFDALPFLKMARQQIIKENGHAARVQRYRKALGRTQGTLGQIRSPEGKKQR
ncbi:MAG: nucleotidyltransferase domain-containing protein [Desulfobacterales bacterium]|nr:nucleotidyltransferase domain-containing protein [Desulfobacterales bacterium]